MIIYNVFGGHIFFETTDLLDSEILYNKILGEIYKGNFYNLNNLLDGEYKWYYFTRVFFLINFFYSFLSIERAFILIDFFIKIFAFISFFKLSDYLGNKKIFTFLISLSYSYAITSTTINLHHSVYGFGASILPYLTYLALKKKDLKISNYIILFFVAANTHFYMVITFPIFFLIFFYLENKKGLWILFKISIFYILICTIFNSQFLYLSLIKNVTFNRDIWVKDSLPLKENLFSIIQNITHSKWYFSQFDEENNSKKILYLPHFFRDLPYILIYCLVISLLILKKIKKYKYFLIIIILIISICFIEKTFFFTNLINNFNVGIIKSINFERVKVVLPFFILFALANTNFKKNILKNNLKKIVYFVLIVSFILFQYNRYIIPYTKYLINYDQLEYNQKIQLKKNFVEFKLIQLFKNFKFLLANGQVSKKHFLTIENYYNVDDFSFIKKIVKNDVVLPINVDPAKLIFNNIKILGGYFQFYPIDYKNNFYLIIETELRENLRDYLYFVKRGHRIYASIKNPQNIKLNFEQAKKMKAKYVFIDQRINDSRLEVICESCNSNKSFNLYYIK